MMPTIFTRNPVRDHLSRIYKVTWLSLQRGAEARSNKDDFEEEERLSDVDHKLDQVLTELVKYFSRLDRLVADKTEQFQKGWFLSFLANDRTGPLSIAAIDKDSERSALTAIFEKFNMAPDSYKGQLEQHLELAERAMAAYRSDGGIKFTDFLIAYDVMRLHSLVEQWQRLQESQKEIYLPKTEFIRIASDMLFRKRIDVNRSNQVIIAHDDGNKIPVSSLSSGEKQLLIFLSETLLQEQEPYLFMADEPELSLHVEWQEELVPNLLKINPNAQVLFATHSPDIVNIYQNNIHKMEELIG
ncbi:AAA family ATPase [Sphingomonas histidinilytica]|uniref:AAA family ATPase n=1 Tax=Rhizorhabdus histidinilytica TaxID=439228 RepID=UPI001AD9B9B7|nr:AAA family ATPase [Rhizorhabdus histidinilytica]MBO9379828.1 AAA family ATPase [Rhizorhabdus histidinilytica]